MSEATGFFTIIFIFLVAAAFYLLPGIVASKRQHQDAPAIWATAIFLGWSGIGWLVALIWSLTAVRRADGR